MICEDIEKKLLALAEGTLPEAEKEKLEAHIQECARCESYASFMKLVGGKSSFEMEGLSPQFWPKLYQRIRVYDAAQAGRRSRSAAVRLWLRPLLASTCLLLGIWAGIELGSDYSIRVLPLEIPAAPSTAPAESIPYWEIFEGLPPGSISELFAKEHLDERSEQ